MLYFCVRYSSVNRIGVISFLRTWDNSPRNYLYLGPLGDSSLCTCPRGHDVPLFVTLQWFPTALRIKSDSSPWPSRPCMTWLSLLTNCFPTVSHCSLHSSCIGPLSVLKHTRPFPAPETFALASSTAWNILHSGLILSGWVIYVVDI